MSASTMARTCPTAFFLPISKFSAYLFFHSNFRFSMIIEFPGSMFFDIATVLSVHLSATRMICAGGIDCSRIPSSDFRMCDSSLWAQINTVTLTGKKELLDVHREQIDYGCNNEEKGEGHVPKQETSCYQY